MEDHFLRVRDGYSQKMDSTWAVAPPHPALRGMVQPYIGYVTSTKAPEFHLGLPSPYVTFVLTLDTPLTLLGNEDVRDVRAGVGGLQLEPVVIDQRVSQRDHDSPFFGRGDIPHVIERPLELREAGHGREKDSQDTERTADG